MLDAQKFPGPAGPGANAAVLDPASLEQLRALDPQGSGGFVLRVLGTYQRSLMRHHEAISSAWSAQDLPALSQAAHALKSASASVGALALSRCCAAIEEAVRLDQPAGLGALVQDFVAEAERVRLAVAAQVEGAAS